MTETITVKVWSGNQYADYDEILDEEPDVYEMQSVKTEFGKLHEVSDEERVTLADSIEHHGTYAFDVEHDERVKLNVHANDSYHNPEDWGKPIERGLLFNPEDDYPPFKCEIWGRIMMWVEEDE